MIDSITHSDTTSEHSTNDSGYRAFRARHQDRTALIDPPLEDAELLIKRNRALAVADADEPDNMWSGLAKEARQQLLSDAQHYTSAYRDTPQLPLRGSHPIVMAGHQPTLFHPGVWFKNFTLNRVGNDIGAQAVNLVIDNDVAASRSIRVPVRDSLGQVRVQSVAYDLGGAGIPFEQSKIRDLRQFDAFEREVKNAISPLVANPLISRLWPHARDSIRRCEIAGCALAQARHALEAELGWNTLEIPLGVAVRGLPFARFVMEIIDDAERFQTVYNDSADHYRAWHGIRSTAHPVPNLTVDGPWRELPLWLYGNDSPTRRAVWVRRTGQHWELSDRPDLSEQADSNKQPDWSKQRTDAPTSVLLPIENREAAAEILAEHASPEWKLRPRALVTTMFARLLLSDLFLHGIGGGKYDQLADRIMAQFFGVTPPEFQVVSATLRLPEQSLDGNRGAKINQIRRRIRDTRYQGERWHDSAGGGLRSLIEAKQELLAKIPEKGHRGTWHSQMESLNLQMSRLLEPERIRLGAELESLRQDAAEEAILASREWSFCLFEIEDLVSSFERMVSKRGVRH